MPTYERMIVFRLGRIRTPQGPGMVLLLPFIDSFQRVDLRTRAFNVPPCKVRGFPVALDRQSGGLWRVFYGCHDIGLKVAFWESGRRDQKVKIKARRASSLFIPDATYLGTPFCL